MSEAVLSESEILTGDGEKGSSIIHGWGSAVKSETSAARCENSVEFGDDLVIQRDARAKGGLDHININKTREMTRDNAECTSQNQIFENPDETF